MKSKIDWKVVSQEKVGFHDIKVGDYFSYGVNSTNFALLVCIFKDMFDRVFFVDPRDSNNKPVAVSEANFNTYYTNRLVRAEVVIKERGSLYILVKKNGEGVVSTMSVEAEHLERYVELYKNAKGFSILAIKKVNWTEGENEAGKISLA